jgi:hemerythrin-like domain-containing protein
MRDGGEDVMTRVLDMIRDEHLSMSRMLGLLERQIGFFEQGMRLDYELVKEVLDYFVTFCDLCHHPKEDLILAKLQQRAPELARSVGDLEGAHAEISKELHDFSHAVMNVLLDMEVPRNSFVRLARAFIDQERQHMAEEESVFLPAAQAGLSAEDWADIAAKTEKFRDPLPRSSAALEFLRRHGSRIS